MQYIILKIGCIYTIYLYYIDIMYSLSTCVSIYILGIHTLYGMDIAYSGIIIMTFLCGSSLPYTSYHTHPLLSSSVSEFWGVRWNPLITKSLQYSYYIPCIQQYNIRWLAILYCFIGSAILHAYAIYITTWDIYDTYLMFTFFFLSGVFTAIEHVCIHICGIPEYYNKYIFIHSNSIDTKAYYQWLLEALTSITMVIIILTYTKSTILYWENNKYTYMITMIIITITSYIYYNYNIIQQKYKNDNLTLSHKVIILTLKTIGWIYTSLVLIILVPRWSIPTGHAIDVDTPVSVVIGPLLRSVYGQ